MNDIIIIIKSSEDLDELIDGVTEKVKYAIKKTRKRVSWIFLTSLEAWLVQPVFSSVVKNINGGGVRRGGRGYMNKTF